ncbi:uncharacterized protein M6B38_395975 [Iris pallida]|uniref:Uncharacterized protein n=1 Tax=Iris pallida TaxID=29817 RepID=A0AAX6FVZ5_IRIPA|nr:uncharacterized protein M6B38_150110 [Iris pallida]KAJ6820629.1 uncharacterized protein M6B38_395975 [Iris pallida]
MLGKEIAGGSRRRSKVVRSALVLGCGGKSPPASEGLRIDTTHEMEGGSVLPTCGSGSHGEHRRDGRSHRPARRRSLHGGAESSRQRRRRSGVRRRRSRAGGREGGR